MQLQAEFYAPENPIHQAALKYIFDNLRPEELYECAAVGKAPVELRDLLRASAQLGLSETWLLYHQGMPVFVWGVTKAHDGMFGLWGFGTSKTRRAMPAITRWGMKTWLPDFTARTNPRRIEVRVPVSSNHSISWLRKLGLEIECTLPNYSIHGEDFFQLATPREYFENVLIPFDQDHRGSHASASC